MSSIAVDVSAQRDVITTPQASHSLFVFRNAAASALSLHFVVEGITFTEIIDGFVYLAQQFARLTDRGLGFQRKEAESTPIWFVRNTNCKAAKRSMRKALLKFL